MHRAIELLNRIGRIHVLTALNENNERQRTYRDQRQLSEPITFRFDRGAGVIAFIALANHSGPIC